MKTFISFDEARGMVLAEGRMTDAHPVPLSKAVGLTLAREVVAGGDIPPFTNSAMDGFAVRARDVASPGTELRVTGHIPAGALPSGEVSRGTCMSIMTGAPLPEGADAVVPVEWTSQEGELVSIDRAARAGQNVRPAGEDLHMGQRVFFAGDVIAPPVVGMLATLGIDPVWVRIPPRVAVISTGDEIVPPDRDPGPGQIRNSNGPALRAQVMDAGGQCDAYLHAPDDREAIMEVIRRALPADLLLFSGGVSVGQHDHVKEALERSGMVSVFWKVKQRPGKPLSFGILEGVPVLGLPGNPVSSAICFEMFARPLLATMLGRRHIHRALLKGRLEAAVTKVGDLTTFARGVARLEPGSGYLLSETGPQGSNLYGSMVTANCIIHLPDGVERLDEGALVDFEMLDWGSLG